MNDQSHFVWLPRLLLGAVATVVRISTTYLSNTSCFVSSCHTHFPFSLEPAAEAYIEQDKYTANQMKLFDVINSSVSVLLLARAACYQPMMLPTYDASLLCV